MPKHTEATASDLFAPTSGFIQFPQHFDFNAARTPQAREPQTEAWTPISSSSTSLNVVKTLPAGAQVMSRRRQRSSPEPSIGAMVASATHCFQLAFPGQCQTVRPQKRVRSALGAVEKAKVRDVRKKKACLRCHLQKISVSRVGFSSRYSCADLILHVVRWQHSMPTVPKSARQDQILSSSLLEAKS